MFGGGRRKKNKKGKRERARLSGWLQFHAVVTAGFSPLAFYERGGSRRDGGRRGRGSRGGGGGGAEKQLFAFSSLSPFLVYRVPFFFFSCESFSPLSLCFLTPLARVHRRSSSSISKVNARKKGKRGTRTHAKKESTAPKWLARQPREAGNAIQKESPSHAESYMQGPIQAQTGRHTQARRSMLSVLAYSSFSRRMCGSKESGRKRRKNRRGSSSRFLTVG